MYYTLSHKHIMYYVLYFIISTFYILYIIITNRFYIFSPSTFIALVFGTQERIMRGQH